MPCDAYGASAQCHDAGHYEAERYALLSGRCAHHHEEPECYRRDLPECYVVPCLTGRCHAWTWECGEQAQCVRAEGHDEAHTDGCITWWTRPIVRVV